MSENLDLVHSILVDWERGDFSSAEWAHPEIEYVITDGPGTRKELAGMASGWRDWMGSWESFRIEADEYRELDAERVLVIAHVSGRARMSGLEVGAMPIEGAGVFHVRPP